MILVFAFVLPFLGALLCLGLNRVLETRWLGLFAAAVLAVSAALLLVARSAGTLALADRPWLEFNGQRIQLSLGYDFVSLPVAVLAAAGGACALLALALALPAKLRNYGGLIATLLLVLDATLVGLAIRETLLLPVAWAALPLLSFVALRASGGQNDAQVLPAGLLGNLLGAVALLGAVLSMRAAGPGALIPGIALLATSVAALLGLGLPPFHRVVNDLAEVPANIAAPLLAFGLPLLASTTLMRFISQAILPARWAAALQLFGVLAVLVCGAGALRERRLRRIIGWQMSAQYALLLVALAQNQAVLAAVAPALIANAALVSCVALVAVGLVERRAGTDDLSEIRLSAPLVAPGLALLVAAASSVGAPGTLGFLAFRSLYESLQRSTPLLVGPLLAAASLVAVAWLAPVAAFLRTPVERSDHATSVNVLALLCPLVLALPLVVFGLAPSLAWNSWLNASRLALLPPNDTSMVSLPGMLTTIIGVIVLAALSVLAMFHSRMKRRTLADPELQPAGTMTPDALGESLQGVAWLGAPSNLFASLWQAVAWLSRGLGWALGFLEQRYYVAGLMIAVVAVILLLLQG